MMKFVWGNQEVHLKGVIPQQLQVAEGKVSLKHIGNDIHLCMLHVNTVLGEQQSLSLIACSHSVPNAPEDDTCLRNFKAAFHNVFVDPTGLPPSRGVFDHTIPIEHGARPVNIRPYSYPLKQRDIIENMVQETLNMGVIQHSNSPYASPVVLVGKKDGSWCLCVDYRRLNQQTIKNKFPIPILEELVDKLSGARIFSKVDLRSGYHQLRMNASDVFKTAFKTHLGYFEFLVMPFGLTNAPTSFQNWMNQVFKPLFRKCVLIFFVDILIYSKSKEEHWTHLQQVFQIMRVNKMHANESKCVFIASKVEYLGHFISGQGVETDPQKVDAIHSWPTPHNVKELRSFLGLTSYYRKFIKDYASINRPLHNLYKKGAFTWIDESNQDMIALKRALTTAPVLALHNFDDVFEIETDASKDSIGAVLMQHNHPIVYISMSLGPKGQRLSVYEKELLALVFSVQKWNQYLIENHIVRTDQKSLKWLLHHKVSTPFQQFCLSKLMGFSYEIHHKKGQDNIAADALSRVKGAQLLFMAISLVASNLADQLKASYLLDTHLQDILGKLNQDMVVSNYTFLDDLLRRKGKLVVGPDQKLRKTIIDWHHSSVEAGHPGRDGTTRRFKALFYWKGLTKTVRQFVQECLVCQAAKHETTAIPGKLQPLVIPAEVWIDVSMDFISGVPMSMRYNVILVVVERFSNYAHFIPLYHPYTAVEVAQAYPDFVFKLHGWPRSIVSNRDPIFVRNFW